MNDYYVYMITRRDGTPLYVGKGRGDRWLRYSKKRATHNKHLNRVFVRDGYDLPIVKLYENLSNVEASELEIAIIAKIGRTVDGGPLVNATRGGEGQCGRVWSAESRAKVSASGKRRFQDPEQLQALRARDCWTEAFRKRQSEIMVAAWQNPIFRQRGETCRIGTKLSQQHKDRIRATMRTPEQLERARLAATGRVLPKEQRAKISVSLRGRECTPEQRAKISAKLKGKKRTPEQCAHLRAVRKLYFARKFAEGEGWGMRA